MDTPKPMGQPLGNDRILSVSDVSHIMGCCPSVASKIMHETGHCLTVHSRLYLLESELLRYIRRGAK